jgi:hypothetical protein
VSSDQWFDIVNFGLVVLIWLVQLIIYPSLAHVDGAEFKTWHRRYMQLITIIVGPLMAAQMALAVQVFLLARDSAGLLILAGIALVWASSLLLSVPCHQSLLRRGKDRAIINRLVLTNWIRTVLWSGIFLLGLSR